MAPAVLALCSLKRPKNLCLHVQRIFEHSDIIVVQSIPKAHCHPTDVVHDSNESTPEMVPSAVILTLAAHVAPYQQGLYKGRRWQLPVGLYLKLSAISVEQPTPKYYIVYHNLSIWMDACQLGRCMPF